jgi:hypothetical protein
LRDVVGGGESGGHRVGDGGADGGPLHRGGVDVVVAHVDAVGGGEIELGGEFLQRGEFVGAALNEVRDFQFGGANGRGAGAAAADPSGEDAGFFEAFEAHAVENGKALGLGAVGVDLNGAVGEDAVDVHREEADAGPREFGGGGWHRDAFSCS